MEKGPVEPGLWNFKAGDTTQHFVSPRFPIKDIRKLTGVSKEALNELAEAERDKDVRFLSGTIILDSVELPFLCATVMTFFQQECFVKYSGLNSFIVLINKIGEVKMVEHEREELKKMVINLREKAVKQAKTWDHQDSYDEALSEPMFQHLLIDRFYRSYLLMYARGPEKKHMAAPSQNLEDCFKATSRLFKVVFKIYEVKADGELRLQREIGEPSEHIYSNIHLIFHKQVFVLLNISAYIHEKWSPNACANIQENFQDPKVWLQIARTSPKINARLGKELPPPREQESLDDEDDLDDILPSRAKRIERSSPEKQIQESKKEREEDEGGDREEMKQSKLEEAISEKDKKAFKGFLQRTVGIIMKSYGRLGETQQTEVFEELREYFAGLRREKFDCPALGEFKRAVKSAINEHL